MKSSYKRIGNYVKQVNNRNKGMSVTNLQGININKKFMPSVANTNGTDLSKYKVVSRKQFAFNPMHVGRDEVLPISMLDSEKSVIVSPAYIVFSVIDENELLPEYLMMWCQRPEFDRNAWFTTDSSVRGGFSWKDFCDLKLPVPSIEKQRKIVKEYNTITDRIKLNEQLNQKLEETAQAIYKQWFVDFDFPVSKEYALEIGKPELEGKPYKSSGCEMVYDDELDQEIPKGWKLGTLNDIAKITMGQSPSGESYNDKAKGEIFYQGRTDFGFRFPCVRTYTTEPKRKAKKGDILISVRAPVGDINIANKDCCIGRGLASINSRMGYNSFLFYLMKNIRKRFNESNNEGTIFNSITKDALYSIYILNPYNSILDEFEFTVKKIDYAIALYCEETTSLNKIKNMSLSKMTKVEEIK
jgi:type I restriction enzyme S subunit